MRHRTIFVVLSGVLTSGVLMSAAIACASSPASSTASGATAGATATGSVAAPPPSPAVEGRFVLTQWSDTIGSEHFSRTNDRLRAEFTARGVEAFRYDAELAPDASVKRIRLTVRPPAGGAQTSTAAFAGDSVTLTREAPGDSARSARRPAAPGSVPYVNPSPSLMEQIVRRARVLGGGTASVPVFVGGAGPANVTAVVDFAASDSARLELGGVSVLLRVDGAGAILGGSVPSQRLTISRTAAN